MGLRGIWGTVWALTFISATQVDAQESGGTSTETINLSQYVSGGTVGTAVGFGIGHALVGEYARIGWVFTMTEVLSVGLISGGCALRIEERRSRPQSEQNPYDRSSIGLAGLLLTMAGALAFVAFRSWETVDIWRRPLRRLFVERRKPQYAFIPAFRARGVSLAFSFNF